MPALRLSAALCLLAAFPTTLAWSASVQPNEFLPWALARLAARPPASAPPSPRAITPQVKNHHFETIFTFADSTDGNLPNAVAAGPHGSLLGTTAFGGLSKQPDGFGRTGFGTLYQLTPPGTAGNTWTFTRIHSFSGGADGGLPNDLLVGSGGKVFGETDLGGTGSCVCEQDGVAVKGCGLVFELTPPQAGQSKWTQTVIYDFQGGADGAYPEVGLVQNAEGDLFGTTTQTGDCAPNGCGTVFKLTPPAYGGTQWTKTTLWTFNTIRGGRYPTVTMALDQVGRLFGVATEGGYQGDYTCNKLDYRGCGVVFMLTPPKQDGAAWKEQTLWRFSGQDGVAPYASVTLDSNGNLYGLTNSGGNPDYCKASFGCGTLYKLTPPADGGPGAWTLSLPWRFTNGTDGSYPLVAGLTPFFNNYLTTTTGDEISTFGSIDLFVPSTGRAGWKEKTLFTFTDDADGESPEAQLLDRNGTIFGTTLGADGTGPAPVSYGTIYSFTP